jgi:hypothetical protein
MYNSPQSATGQIANRIPRKSGTCQIVQRHIQRS